MNIIERLKRASVEENWDMVDDVIDILEGSSSEELQESVAYGQPHRETRQVSEEYRVVNGIKIPIIQRKGYYPKEKTNLFSDKGAEKGGWTITEES